MICKVKGGENVTLEFEVRRVRMSVTQGEALVYCNGQYIINFADEPELIKPGEKYFGELIGGWASTTPDAKFIYATLFHKYDAFYHTSGGVQKIINAAMEQEVEAAQRGF